MQCLKKIQFSAEILTSKLEWMCQCLVSMATCLMIIKFITYFHKSGVKYQFYQIFAKAYVSVK